RDYKVTGVQTCALPIYVAQAGQARKVFRKDLQSGQTTQLTQGAVDDVQPAWSPDGTKILYVRSQGQKIQPSDIFGVFLDADVWQIGRASCRESVEIGGA